MYLLKIYKFVNFMTKTNVIAKLFYFEKKKNFMAAKILETIK